MPNYNNNDKQPMVNTYTPISFTNPGSSVMDTRFSIGYLNRVMRITIAARTNPGSTDFAKYDTDHPVDIYISYSKAKMLHDAIIEMKKRPNEINNVCVELKNGLLKVSNGVEYGSLNPCFSIAYADDSNNMHEIVYECKGGDTYFAAYNYQDNQYSTIKFDNFELDTFCMVLEQYYVASSYAIAASVKESNMYSNNNLSNTIKEIAGKLGIQTNTGNRSSGSFNNKSFLSGGANGSGGSSNTISGGVPEEYTQASFSDIANSLG